MRLAALLLIFFAFAGCDESQWPDDVPRCIKDKVRNDDPLEVWRYTYQQQTVYLIVPDCCDQFTVVYSSSCDYLCAPSGGITGDGDGKCPEFSDEATHGELLWKAD